VQETDNRIQMTDGEDMTLYTYDTLNRLAQAIYPTSTVTCEVRAGVTGFFWDAGAHGLEGGNVRSFTV
jgi:hypothetical protein